MSLLRSGISPTEGISSIRVGRSPLGVVESARRFKSDPLGRFAQLAAAGDLVPFRFLGLRTIFVNHPELARTILVERPKHYTKNALLLQLVKPLLGDSLISSEGEIWRRQRRAMQPAFHRQQIAAWGTVMTEATSMLLDQWAKEAQRGEPFAAMPSLMQLTLSIASRALFDARLSDQAEQLSALFAEANRLLAAYFTQPIPPLFVPTPRNLKLQATIRRLHRDAALLLRDRRRDRGIHHDLLALLLSSTDEQGRSLSVRLLRENLLAFLFVGYETTAVALAWALVLLSQHPTVQERAAAEVETVLAGRTPTMEDLAQLPYILMVVEEALRVYPPPAFLIRKAEQADTIQGLDIPRGALIFICPYILHRHPAFWPQPERFDLERFTPEQVAARLRLAYIPFNAGPHQCIGNQFALVEMHLAMAMVLQHYPVQLPEASEVLPEALLSIRPRGGSLPLVLQPRASAGLPTNRAQVPLASGGSAALSEHGRLPGAR